MRSGSWSSGYSGETTTECRKICCIFATILPKRQKTVKYAKKVLKNPKTNALIIELAGYNRYGSSDEKVHDLMIQNNFFPIKYFPNKRVFSKLKTFREDQFNTIYIRDAQFVKNRLIHSPKYKIGEKWI